MKLYAVKVAKIRVPDDADVQTREIARVLMEQSRQHIYLGETWGDAEARLRSAIESIRKFQLVKGRWEVEIAGKDFREDMRFDGVFFVGEHEQMIFPAQAPATAEGGAK